MPRAALCLPLVTLLLRAGDSGFDTLEKAGRWKELRARVQVQLVAAPRDPQVLLWSSRVKAAFGDLEGALAQGREALTLAPQQADVLAQVALVLGQKANQETSKLTQFSLAREMKKLGEQALVLQPGHPEATQLMARFYRMAPGLIGGDNAKAWKLAQALADKDPAQGYPLLAELALMDKEAPKAVAYYREGIQKAADPYGPLVGLGNYLVGEAGEAEVPALLKRAIALHPERAGARGILAYLQAKQGNLAALDAGLVEWERLTPGNLGPHYYAALAFLKEGRELPRAEALLRRYLTVEPEGQRPTHAQAWRQLGLSLEKQGRKPEAIAALESALKLNPNLKSAQGDLKRLRG
ncbi:MAG TPA: tetratricopeptide repeat protein [Holophagaceae bacterium]|nr:tetratricopeptide repeat protein [Holophagaceae bacterium]